MMIFCAGRVSAVGPARIRRSRRAGSRFIRYTVVAADAAVKIARKTHPAQ
jgi:hypothetical protein